MLALELAARRTVAFLSVAALLALALASGSPVLRRDSYRESKALFVCTQSSAYVEAYLRDKDVGACADGLRADAFDTCFDQVMAFEQCRGLARVHNGDLAVFALFGALFLFVMCSV